MSDSRWAHHHLPFLPLVAILFASLLQLLGYSVLAYKVQRDFEDLYGSGDLMEGRVGFVVPVGAGLRGFPYVSPPGANWLGLLLMMIRWAVVGCLWSFGFAAVDLLLLIEGRLRPEYAIGVAVVGAVAAAWRGLAVEGEAEGAAVLGAGYVWYFLLAFWEVRRRRCGVADVEEGAWKGLEKGAW